MISLYFTCYCHNFCTVISAFWLYFHEWGLIFWGILFFVGWTHLSIKGLSTPTLLRKTGFKHFIIHCVPSLTDLLNNAINNFHWLLELGSSIITPAHKRSSTTAKENYCPISVLPLVSKIFEKLLYDQLMEYMDDKLSPFLCGLENNTVPSLHSSICLNNGNTV